jgi:hypothetical protein
MDVVLLAVIGLVALVGLVAIAIGNKGWSWGTVAAAILLLFAATGYLYLAARLAERERAWRGDIAKKQLEVDRLLGEDSKAVAALRAQRDRWTRALAFVDTWHGRSWTDAELNPPRDGKPGTVTIPMASEESEKAPLAAGAEVAVFDNTAVADGGRFLGLFRVQAVKANKGDENSTLTIVPASWPAPPSPDEISLSTRNYDAVTVYENLPVDRWLAFYTTPDKPAGADADGSDAAASAADRWRPLPRKTTAEQTLGSLERQMEALRQHDEKVPEEQWPQLGEKLTAGELLPGRYWATVEFTAKVIFTKKGKFAIDDSAEAEPSGDPDDPDEGPGEPGATIEPGAPVGGDAEAGGVGGVPKNPEPTAGAVTQRFRQKRFQVGEEAEFDLQTALELQNDKQWVRIKSVTERRLLTDPATALRGAEFGGKTADGKPLRSVGVDAIRQALLVEMASIDEASARIKTSRDEMKTQTDAVADETQQLTGDLSSWEKDASAAEETATAFDDRLRAATIELAAVESSIVRLGRELGADWTVLTEAVDGAAAQ